VLDDELALHQLRTVFLEFVEDTHARHGYEIDYRVLAARLGITVQFGLTNQAVTGHSGRTIVIDPRVTANRERFTGLHEIAHHLFEEAEAGYLRARLKDLFHRHKDIAKTYEEKLCDAAAALLLMPRAQLHAALDAHGYTPLAALQLVRECEASLQTAARRVVWNRDVPSFAFLLESDGEVIDAFGHGHAKGYAPGINFVIEREHGLRTRQYVTDRLEEFEAPVPFKHGGRKWIMLARAVCDSRGRVLTFFNPSEISPLRNREQSSLF
jgi:hypothetical protein